MDIQKLRKLSAMVALAFSGLFMVGCDNTENQESPGNEEQQQENNQQDNGDESDDGGGY